MVSSGETLHASCDGSVRERTQVEWLVCQIREARMFHFLLLGVFTAGVATLTFALMALASMASVGYRSRGSTPGRP